MPSEQPFNSQSLQARFPEVYREFFSKCPLVVSGVRTFTWAGDFADLYGGPSILQGIPLRQYIGIEPTDKGIEFTSHSSYVPKDDAFVEGFPPEVLQSQLTEFLTNQTELPTSYKIHQLSELPINYGPSGNGAVNAALAVALLLKQGTISPIQFNQWQTQPTVELFRDDGFDKTLRLAWKMEVAYTLHNAPGTQSFANLVGCEFPTIYIKNTKDKGKMFDPLGPPSYHHVDRSVYSGFRLKDILHFPKFLWPVDIAIVYSGIPKITGPVVQATRGVEDQVNSYKLLLKKLEKLVSPATFFQLVGGDENFYLSHIRSMTVTAFSVLFYLHEIFERGQSEQAIANLVESINNYHRVVSSTGSIPYRIARLMFRLRESLGEASGNPIATKIIGAGGGGSILIVGPFGSLRKLPAILARLRTPFPEIFLNYASWRDGFAEGGVRIEQNLQDGVYSSFISPRTYKLTKILKGGAETTILSAEALEKSRNKMELLLNSVDQEISVLGRRLSSKEIHSAKMTISIFKSLRNADHRELKSSDLPASSYTTDRNEFQSKIISPLDQVVYRRFKQHLPIRLHGGITNFSIRLERSDLPIYLVEPISP